MIALLLLVTACTATVLPAIVDVDAPAAPTEEAATTDSKNAVETSAPADPTAATLEDAPVAAPEDTETAVSEETPTHEPEDASQPTLLPEEAPPFGVEREFSTDFSIHTVPYSEILSGGPPKDGIPAIDNPQFVSVVEADQWLDDLEPVSVFEENGDVRIYPYQILIWHEIANDIVGGRPVAVTFCPLCNTAIIFDATVNGMQLDFGTTGRLRFSNLIMYDRQTESWWQQAGGDAIAGELTGTRLTFLPASTVSWSEARDTFPEAQVLSQETGFNRPYGSNPYAGYDNINNSPFLFDGPPTPGELPPMARVTTVDLNGEAVAYPNDTLKEAGVVNDTVGGTDVAVFWHSGLASALDDSSLAGGQDVGASGVFERALNGQTLTFVTDGDTVTDEQTGSTWNILGQATEGELAGEELTPVVKVDHFWFSWAAFRPDTRIYQG
jgi:hypothetical protein